MLQSPWHISLLGGFAIRQRSRDATPGVTNQAALLLAILADRVGKPHRRSELIEELWPDVDGETGQNRFRVLLASLRRILEPPGTPQGSILVGDRATVGLSSNGCRVDVDEFQRHIQKAQIATSNDGRIEHYKAADALYNGDFMGGRTGDWVFSRRSFYARQQSLAQFKFSALLEESGDIPGAMMQITRSVAADPLREAPRRRSLRFLVELGDVGSALAEYEEYRQLLKRSVGLVPTSEFQDWIKGLRGWAGTTRKGIAREDLANSAEPNTPAVTSVESGRLFLPPSLTTFIGRIAELSDLSDLLPLYRWITLTGPGGIGKTRLAIETARANISQFGGGVFYVPVTEASGSSMLLETILQQIQLEPSTEPLETLKRYISQPIESGRNACLFVLDCIDQLSNDTNQVVLRLLAEIPNATILATARKGRGASDEHEFPIGPLSVPDSDMRLDNLLANASVQLFFERAQAAAARFSVTRANAEEVIALCRRLEGIPLAIELAAAQAGKESPTNILQKLSDLGSLYDTKGWREPRHRSLHASLEFSLDSLDAADQALFCSLCVFRGALDPSAASIVAGASTDDLARLAEHSLLNRAPNSEARRYTMLDLIREFGWSRLSYTEKANVQERHAGYYRQLVADAELIHHTSGIQDMPKLRSELENIRAALEFYLRAKDATSAIRMTAGLSSLWIYAGYQQEGRDNVRRIRAMFVLSDVQEAGLSATDGLLACFQDDPDSGREQIQNALPILEEAGLTHYVAGLRWVLAYAAYLKGDFEECLRFADELQLTLTGRQGRLDTYRQNLVGFAFCEVGRLDEATEILLDVQQRWQELGDRIYADYCNLNLARVRWRRGQLVEAWDEYRNVVAVFGQWNNTRGKAYSVEGLGRVASDLERFNQAAKLLGAAQRLRESIGLRRDFADEKAYVIAADRARVALAADFDSEWQAGYAIPPDRVCDWVASLS